MENQETEAARTDENPADKRKITQFEVLIEQTKLELIISNFDRINWYVIEEVIRLTPDDLKSTPSYIILTETRGLYSKIANLYKEEN